VEKLVPHAPARLLDVLELVGEHLLGVVQQATDQGALAVVDRARGGEAKQLGGPLGQPPEDLLPLGDQRLVLGRRRPQRLLRLPCSGARRRGCPVAVVRPRDLARTARGIHQKYPCRLRSSIAASVTLSSPRVW